MQFIFSVPQRRDNGVWSLPGGMVDPGEGVTTTLDVGSAMAIKWGNAFG